MAPGATWLTLPCFWIRSRASGALTYTLLPADVVPASVEAMLAVLTSGTAAPTGYGLLIVTASVTVNGPVPDETLPTFHVAVRVPATYEPPFEALTKSRPAGSTSVMTALVTFTGESFEYVIV